MIARLKKLFRKRSRERDPVEEWLEQFNVSVLRYKYGKDTYVRELENRIVKLEGEVRVKNNAIRMLADHLQEAYEKLHLREARNFLENK